ncbi:NADH-quinone oxidoreductase subunit NuoG [Microbulbifer spongiae]|uniref:NADH-quinone oxidoreductase n=1 Tax=Microbulbifer spongiae TaxID=2944933 RepID=A0ABY9EDK8_9GAMM|nr:NADH-quinone oxidoreductase subunit NuoG [Microbulbifer sp. MI-G]WKD48831.1 NADH-quinone oxidoreductase subunit NuoG [Microbulbifer sp. MI-G]
MPTITIDGEKYQVDGEQNLLSTCLSLGLNIPYFCWHPAMGSVGACRQCAMIEYKDKEDQGGRLIMSCMTPIRDGAIYSIGADAAETFRGSIIENLMINHPHDCPVCEEGGECHLQDMTEMSGHTMRRYRGTKRTHRNQYLGPFINHEMNRCITCYRCVRFYEDYAGGTDLQALGRNHQVYFGRREEGRLENGFSGNLVEVCPTGVFTDKTFSAHFVRKWDLQTAPSICEHCAVGCNTAPGAREPGNGHEPILRRVINLYHRDINGYFLCDRGRFGYEYINSATRIEKVFRARHEAVISSTAENDHQLHREVAPQKALLHLAQRISQAQGNRRHILGIGSPRSSLENNFALRQLVGRENFFSGLNQRDQALLHLVNSIQSDNRVLCPSTPEIEAADAVLIVAEDIYNTAPRISLAIRQAARNRQKQQAQSLKIPLWQDASVRQLEGDHSPIIFAGTELTDLEDIASTALFMSAEKVVQFARALPPLLSNPENIPAGLEPHQREIAVHTAEILRKAKNPLIVSGTSSRNTEILRATAQIATTLSEQKAAPVMLYLACDEANSLGLTQFFSGESGYLEQLLQTLREEGRNEVPTTLIVLENDLYRRLDRKSLADLFEHIDEVVVLDTLFHSTSKRADWIFPAAATAESQGTFVNSNGLAQRFYAIYEGKGFIQESWRWLVDAAAFCTEKSETLSQIACWKHSTDLSEAIAREFSALEVLSVLGPDENYRIDGLKVARQGVRYSGRTAVHAQEHVSEGPPLQDPDAPMSFSMEGIHNPDRTLLQANIWSPGWNSNQAINKFQEEIGGERKGGPSGLAIKRPEHPMPEWIAPAMGTATRELPDIPNPIQMQPVYRLFGSGELSNQSMCISEAIESPFVLINLAAAKIPGIHDGQPIELVTSCGTYRAEARSAPAMPAGSVGVPFGFPGLETLTPILPAYASLRPAATSTGIED